MKSLLQLLSQSPVIVGMQFGGDLKQSDVETGNVANRYTSMTACRTRASAARRSVNVACIVGEDSSFSVRSMSLYRRSN